LFKYQNESKYGEYNSGNSVSGIPVCLYRTCGVNGVSVEPLHSNDIPWCMYLHVWNNHILIMASHTHTHTLTHHDGTLAHTLLDDDRRTTWMSYTHTHTHSLLQLYTLADGRTTGL
jgi:hypothetical protein